MKRKYLCLLLLLLFVAACSTPYKSTTDTTPHFTDTTTWVDQSRNRPIPLAFYHQPVSANSRQKIVIISPGYGGKQTDYGYIAHNLAVQGYFVVTLQHDLATDAPMPTSGDIHTVRQPFWDCGVQSILYVLNQLKTKYPKLDYKDLILLGHSNGGDMIMQMTAQYPNLARIVITLDNRRVAIPRATTPKLFSIRSNDQPADEGVLPTAGEQLKYHIKIVQVNTTHNDMGGMATDAQKKEINDYIDAYLKENL